MNVIDVYLEGHGVINIDNNNVLYYILKNKETIRKDCGELLGFEAKQSALQVKDK